MLKKIFVNVFLSSFMFSAFVNMDIANKVVKKFINEAFEKGISINLSGTADKLSQTFDSMSLIIAIALILVFFFIFISVHHGKKSGYSFTFETVL